MTEKKENFKDKNMCDIVIEFSDTITTKWFVVIFYMIIPILGIIYTSLYKFDRVESGFNNVLYKFKYSFSTSVDFHIQENDLTKVENFEKTNSVNIGNTYELKFQVLNNADKINTFRRLPQIYLREYDNSSLKGFFFGRERNITNSLNVKVDSLTDKELKHKRELAYIIYTIKFTNERELFSSRKTLIRAKVQRMQDYKEIKSDYFNITKYLKKNNFKYISGLNIPNFSKNLTHNISTKDVIEHTRQNNPDFLKRDEE